MTHTKIKIFVLVLLGVFASNKALAANCYIASDFGQTIANGEYAEFDTYGGATSYFNEDLYLFKCDAAAWCIDDAIPTSGGTNQYYSDNGTNPTSGTWYAQDGAAPPGDFVFDACTEETATTTDFTAYGIWGTIATSTSALIVDNGLPFWEISLGILIALFLLFFLTVGLGKSMRRLLGK